MATGNEDSDQFKSAYSAIVELLTAARRGLDRSTDDSAKRGDGSFQRLRACQLEIEALRISFRRLRIGIYYGESNKRILPIVAEFSDELIQFQQSDNFMAISNNLTYFAPTPRTNEIKSNIHLNHVDFSNLTMREALSLAYSITNDTLLSQQKMMPGLTPVNNLRNIVPAQSIAPVQFIVTNGKVRVKNVSSRYAEEDASNIVVSREELLRKGSALIDDLAKSNADPRLIDSFRELQTAIKSNKNIITVGLANIACDLIGGQCGNELSDPLMIKIQAHSRSVEMYSCQFVDWRKFIENASTTHIEHRTMDQLKTSTDALLSQLSADTENVDSAVPKTLKVIADLCKSPIATSKKIAFALIRSIENLFSAMFSFSAEVLQATAEKTREKFANHASTVIVIAFIGFASGFIAPIADPLKEVAWIRTAVDLVKSQITKLSN